MLGAVGVQFGVQEDAHRNDDADEQENELLGGHGGEVAHEAHRVLHAAHGVVTQAGHVFEGQIDAVLRGVVVQGRDGRGHDLRQDDVGAPRELHEAVGTDGDQDQEQQDGEPLATTEVQPVEREVGEHHRQERRGEVQRGNEHEHDEEQRVRKGRRPGKRGHGWAGLGGERFVRPRSVATQAAGPGGWHRCRNLFRWDGEWMQTVTFVAASPLPGTCGIDLIYGPDGSSFADGSTCCPCHFLRTRGRRGTGEKNAQGGRPRVGGRRVGRGEEGNASS